METPHLLDNRQNPRLRIIISVCANAQVDFLIRRVLAVRPHQAEERVLGCLWDIGGGEERRAGGCRRHHVLSDGRQTLAGRREGTGSGIGTGTDTEP